MRYLITALFVLGLLVAPTGAASADDGDYPPGIPTSCRIDAPRVSVGDRVVLRIRVSSNTNEPEIGSVKLAISTLAARAAGRATRERGVVWTRTVRYEGSPIEVTGPRLPRGSYRVTMAFTPDGGAFSGCRDAATFQVGGGGDTGGEDDGNNSGGLPNTGGPHLWLLLAGLGLLVAGGGLVGDSRRQRVLA